jgi:glyoxalase family protein
MTHAIPGLHHVTAVAGDAQANVDFFTRVMGQRLVKRTVNFDDPGTYHLYYGNRTADPGTILTFFPFAGARPGRGGAGQAAAYAYALAPDAGAEAADRMRHAGATVEAPTQRFGQTVVTVRDPDGAPVELIETGAQAPDGFHSVTLQLAEIEPTRRLLVDVMGYEEEGTEASGGAERLRLRARGARDARGAVVDLLRVDGQGRAVPGAGGIHHVAFRALDDADQLGWRKRLLAAGMDVTPVIDRQYFNAIYFREPGGTLFEIATDPPGFTRDEPLDSLGTALMLPEKYEPIRDRIEAALPRLAA